MKKQRPSTVEPLEPRKLLSASWANVDSVTPGNALDIAADPSGNLYAAGASQPPNLPTGVATVRKSSDGGGTWSTVEQFAPFSGQPSTFTTVASDSQGDLVASGWASDPAGIHHWTTAQSTDGGNTWTQVDDYLYPNYTYTSIFPQRAAISGDSAYVVGWAYQTVTTTTKQGTTTGIVAHWIVRQGSLSNPAGSWHTVSDYQLQNGSSAYASGITVAPSGIFVSGAASTSSSGNYWLVRRSTDGGSTWTTVDSVPQLANPSGRTAITADPSGNIYTGATLLGKSNTVNWTIRKSTDGGASWSTVDSYTPGNFGSAYPYDIYADDTGNVYVSGSVSHAASKLSLGEEHYVVRSSSNAGASWSFSDDYLQVPGTLGNKATGIVATPAGVFSTGYVANSTAAGSFSSNTWVTRKLAPTNSVSTATAASVFSASLVTSSDDDPLHLNHH